MTIYSISKIQNQFRTINIMYPENPAYNMPSVFKINGPLNITILNKSINEIIKRHQILRTTFNETSDGPVQVVHESLKINIPVINLNTIQHITHDIIETMISSEIAISFDLQRGPLLRFRLFQLKSDDFKSSVSYWKNKLKGAETFLNFPVDHPRSELQSPAGAVQAFVISEPLAEKIKIFSRNNSVNTFASLLSAYYVLLHRYTYQTSIIIGLPLTNRRKDEHKEIMGCLMNIVPLGIDNIDEGSFIDLLASVREAMLEAHRNQEIPLEEIISHVNPPRTPGINPLYQTGFAFEPPMEINLNGIESTPLTFHGGGSQLELFLTMWETGETINGRIEYNTALFEGKTISGLIKNYLSLINELIDNSGKPVTGISIKEESIEPNDEEHQSGPACALSFSSINEMINEHTVNTPDKIAVMYKDIQLTYRELDEGSNQLAHHLISAGVTNESLVGVYIERSLEMLIGLIAIHKAGGAYLPLDPEFPAARISYMINHSKLKVIITQSMLLNDIPETDAKIICLDSDSSAISEQKRLAPDCRINGDNLAYVMYTSGSTGQPKGVQITHSSVINFLTSMGKKPGITGNDRLLAVTTISFDISVLELFLPLSCGAATVILSKEVTMDGKLLIDAINRYNPTIMQATPTTWKILFSSGWQGSKTLKVLFGGETMPRDIAQKLSGSVSSVWNMYGPTETTIWSTCFQVIDPEEPVYIGSPFDNTYIYILDNNMQRVPSGVAGEIYIGGAGVARGYLHDSARTTERFLKDPFRDDGSIYKTGDTGRFTFNGSLEFFSRVDSQVKVRGYRIEPLEIEFHLNRFENISDSAAAVVKDSSGIGRIIGYIVPEKNADINCGDLRLFLQEKIPGYMIPDFFITLEKIPLTPNGKIDSKALPAPDLKEIVKERNIVLPANQIEQKLSLIWQEVLSIETIGIFDNYFDLGGNSFLAVEIVNRKTLEFKSSVTVLMQFKYTTIATIAKYLSSTGNDEISSNEEINFIESIKERTAKQKQAYSRLKAGKERTV